MSRKPFMICRAAVEQLRAIPSWVGRLRRDQSGVGAIEFALLFPMLVLVYLTCFELTVGFSVAKRATSSASTVADLVTQQSTVSKTFLNTMSDVSKSIFVPYPTTGFVLKVTGIKVNTAGQATVAWSWKNDGTRPYTNGATVTLPSAMATPDTFLVRSELSIPHELLMYMPDFTGAQIKNITIRREYYYRQRVGTDISCSDC